MRDYNLIFILFLNVFRKWYCCLKVKAVKKEEEAAAENRILKRLLDTS